MVIAERILVVVLRAIAVAASFAVVPVFMPHAWMNTCHRRLASPFALGHVRLPCGPVVDCLAEHLPPRCVVAVA